MESRNEYSEAREEYLIRHLAEAENALFEARNAFMGYDDSNALRLDKMRMKVVDMMIKEKKALERG